MMEYAIKSETESFEDESSADSFLENTSEILATTVKQEVFNSVNEETDYCIPTALTSEEIDMLEGQCELNISNSIKTENENTSFGIEDLQNDLVYERDDILYPEDISFEEYRDSETEETSRDDHSYCLPSSSYKRKILTLRTDSERSNLGLTVHQSRVESHLLPVKVREVEADGPASRAGVNIGDLVYLNMKSSKEDEVELEVIVPISENPLDSPNNELLANNYVDNEIIQTNSNNQQDALNWNCSSLPNMSFDLTRKTLQKWNPEDDVVNDCLLVYYDGKEHPQLLSNPTVNAFDASGEILKAMKKTKKETNFKCKFCEKTFSLKCKWKLHVRQKTCTTDERAREDENTDTADEVECFDINEDEDEYVPPSKKLKESLGSDTQSYLSKETKVKFENMNMHQKLNYLGKLQFELDLRKQQLVQKKTEIREMKNSSNKEKSPIPSKTLSNTSKSTGRETSIGEKPGADYTRLMAPQTLELLEKQTNDENINLIGKLEFELGVTDMRNSKLRSNVCDLENQIKRLKKENDTLKEKKSVEVGVFCPSCKDLEGIPVKDKDEQWAKKIVQRKNNTISMLTSKLAQTPNFDGDALEKDLARLYKHGTDFFDAESLIHLKRGNNLVRENKDLQKKLTEMSKLLLKYNKASELRKMSTGKTIFKPKPYSKVTEAAQNIGKTMPKIISNGEFGKTIYKTPTTSNVTEATPTISKVSSTITGDGIATDQNLTVTTVDFEGVESHQTFEKPEIPLSSLIVLAIMNSSDGKPKTNQIFDYICERFPYYRYTNGHWKRFVKCKLAYSKFFVRFPDGCWALDPSVPVEEMITSGNLKLADTLRTSELKSSRKVDDTMHLPNIIQKKSGERFIHLRPNSTSRQKGVGDEVESNIIETTSVKNINRVYIDNNAKKADPLSHLKVMNEDVCDMDNYEVFGENLSDEAFTETEESALEEGEIFIKMENIDSEVMNQQQLLEMEI